MNPVEIANELAARDDRYREVAVATTSALAIPNKSAESVVTILERAKEWLATAVEMTGPEEIAAAKAQIRTAETYARELGLSKEIQSDAQEMVRRAEYALGKAIRAGQADGTVRTKGQTVTRYAQSGLPRGADREVPIPDISVAPSPTEFASMNELSGDNGNGIYAMVDGVTEPEFDAALTDARHEGNLSRANVVRKIKGVKDDGLTPVEKLVKIRELAPSGMTSGQIGKEIGSSEDYVRRVARENQIEITADRIMAGSRRGIDHTRIVRETVAALEGLTSGLQLLDPSEVDPSDAAYWATSLTDSLRALNRLNRQIKEMTQ